MNIKGSTDNDTIQDFLDIKPILTGRSGADSFDCGAGLDTITDFEEREGDTKTADCENF